MFFPLRPEEGAQHFPAATLGLIGLCVVMFLAEVVGVIDDPGPLHLQYGEINAAQWYTSAVMHFDWFHLLGNMFFLFVFGLIVEGISGTPVFVLLVATSVSLQGLMTQFLMMDFEYSPETLEQFARAGILNPPHPAAAGASGFIFGLMVAAMIWAPRNRIDCVLLLRYFHSYAARRVSVSVLTFVILYIALNVLYAITDDPSTGLTTSWLHLIGAGAGGLLAWILLASGTVDTEGWHLFGSKAHDRHRGF